jgi:hypothetical protein
VHGCRHGTALREFFDYLYIEKQRPVGAGTKLVAAFGWELPRLYHGGRLLKLPRASMALQGWLPGGQRFPWPLGLVIAVCFEMIRSKR